MADKLGIPAPVPAGGIGMHEFTVMAERLPCTLESARKLAAEHRAFAGECACGYEMAWSS